MAEIPTYDELKSILDSPDVSAEEKKQLLLMAEQDNVGRSINGLPFYPPDELAKYEDKLNISDEYRSNFYDNNEWGSFPDKFEEAKKQQGANSAHNKDISKAESSIQDAKEAANRGEYGGAGVKTSDKLLDPARPALDYFQTFLPLYAMVAQRFKPDEIHVGDYKQAVKRYDEQMGIQFGKFADQADELKNAGDKLRQADTHMAKKLAGLWEHWKGKASEDAQEFYGRQHKITEDEVVSKIDDTGHILDVANQNIAKAVRKKAEWVLKYLDDKGTKNGTVAGKTHDEWYNTIKCANDQADEDTLRRTATIWGVQIDDNCDLDGDNARKIRAKARQVTQHQFVKPVSNDWKNFIKMCDNTLHAVDKAFKKVTDESDKLEKDPYGPDKDAGDDKGSHEKGGHDNGGGGDSGGGHQGTGGSNSGGSNSDGDNGGGGGGGSGYTQPDRSNTGDTGETAPSEDSTDPASDSDTPGGDTGTEQQPGKQGDPETVTIRNGDGTIKMTSPDGQGHMKLTVDDGSGEPKTYDVDFGRDSQPGGTAGSTGGQSAGDPGTQRESSPSGGGDTPSPGDSGAAPGDSAGGAQEIQADESGKAVIHDGDETITIQQSPDDPSQVEVTVDDGSGEPTSYTVDYSTTDDASQGETPDGETPSTGSGEQTGSQDGATPGQPADTEPATVAPEDAAPEPANPQAPPPGGSTADGSTPEPSDSAPAGDAPDPTQTDPAAVGGEQWVAAASSEGGQPGIATSGVGQPAGAGAPGVSSPAGSDTSGSHAGGGGMMPMMGGMGGGQGGGDQERGSSQWRTTGDLFDDVGEVDELSGFRAVSGVLGDTK